MVNVLRSSAIIVLGGSANLRSKVAYCLAETIKYPFISNNLPLKLEDIINKSPLGFVLDSESTDDSEVICAWAKENNRRIDVLLLQDSRPEGNEDVKNFEELGARIHKIEVTKDFAKLSKRVFITLAPYIFLESGMAEGYYQLRESCNPANSEHIFISGMPTFVYGGRVLMKDFDILVPSNKLEIIAQTIGTPIRIKDSSVAYTRSSYVGDSVETVADLVVYVEGKKVPFPFDFLWEEVRQVSFMGMDVPIMGLEDLILFKIALGRLGIDDFGKHKDDLSDVEGLIGRQDIDWEKLKQRARKLGLEKRLIEKLSVLNIQPLWK